MVTHKNGIKKQKTQGKKTKICSKETAMPAAAAAAWKTVQQHLAFPRGWLQIWGGEGGGNGVAVGAACVGGKTTATTTTQYGEKPQPTFAAAAWYTTLLRENSSSSVALSRSGSLLSSSLSLYESFLLSLSLGFSQRLQFFLFFSGTSHT